MTITITHIDGPLKGQVETFDDSINDVIFGRDREAAQIVYPPQFDVVGRKHFGLRRTIAGDYTVELFGSRYVAMDGKPVDNGTPVKSGSTFRLGRKDGPAVSVEIGAPSDDTLPVTADQSQMTTSAGRLRHKVAVGGTLLVLGLVGAFVYIGVLQSTFGTQLADVRALAAADAKKEFSQATLQQLQDAVYLVARKEDGKPIAEGTAWAFAAGDPATGTPAKLATNAHVTEAIKGRESEFVLIGPDSKEIEIAKVISHPGYQTFKRYKTTLGTERWGEFTPLDLINEYDVGIIELEPNAALPATLELASTEDLKALTPGTAVASIGFPVEGLAGRDTATDAPATLHFGHISALTDVFMVRAEPDERLLIQHSVPVTGGASGSPLITHDGKVIGIVNGGNTTVFKDKTEGMNAKVRMPNAALINFAQRSDLLRHLADGNASSELAEDKDYWEARSEDFDDYFDVAAAEFTGLAKKRYGVGAPATEMLGSGTLDAGEADSFKLISETYEFEAEPGKLYGFIADASSGVPVGINIKDKSTAAFLRDAKDPRKTSELELAPTAWVRVRRPTLIEVIVWSLVVAPADYQLEVYEWDDVGPPAEPAKDTSSAPTADSES